MKGEQSKLFKFNPIDTEQQKKLIAKTIYPLQNLQEFLIQAQPFSFEAESPEFNDWFFNGEFKQNDILELCPKASNHLYHYNHENRNHHKIECPYYLTDLALF